MLVPRPRGAESHGGIVGAAVHDQAAPGRAVLRVAVGDGVVGVLEVLGDVEHALRPGAQLDAEEALVGLGEPEIGRDQRGAAAGAHGGIGRADAGLDREQLGAAHHAAPHDRTVAAIIVEVGRDAVLRLAVQVGDVGGGARAAVDAGALLLEARIHDLDVDRVELAAADRLQVDADGPGQRVDRRAGAGDLHGVGASGRGCVRSARARAARC